MSDQTPATDERVAELRRHCENAVVPYVSGPAVLSLIARIASERQRRERVEAIAMKAIADESELPDEPTPDMVALLKSGDVERLKHLCLVLVRLTKRRISERLAAALKGEQKDG